MEEASQFVVLSAAGATRILTNRGIISDKTPSSSTTKKIPSNPLRYLHEGGRHRVNLFNADQQLTPHCPKATAFWVSDMKGSIFTHKREKMDASRMDQTMTMVGVRFCFPMRPLRKG